MAMVLTVIADARRTLERRLYGAGFFIPAARQLLGIQIVVCALSLCIGAAALWLTAWPLAFGAGACITTYSLWHIIRFAQASLQDHFSAALAFRQFFGFSARLLLIGTVLFALIVWLRTPVAPLLAGLTSTLVSLVLWGITRFSRKTVKEA